MTDEQLKKLRELAEAATPGPWRWGDAGKEREGVPEKMMNLYAENGRCMPVVWLEPSSGWSTLGANTDFIAAANPQAIIALLDDHAKLQLEVDCHHDAATPAFDEIAKICGCPQWEYPAQVVRDVERLHKHFVEAVTLLGKVMTGGNPTNDDIKRMSALYKEAGVEP